MSLPVLAERLRTECERRGIGLSVEFLGEDRARLVYEREWDNEKRYVRYNFLDEESPWRYAILYGTFANADPREDTDGRSGGDLEYAVTFAIRWLLDRCAYEGLPALR